MKLTFIPALRSAFAEVPVEAEQNPERVARREPVPEVAAETKS